MILWNDALQEISEIFSVMLGVKNLTRPTPCMKCIPPSFTQNHTRVPPRYKTNTKYTYTLCIRVACAYRAIMHSVPFLSHCNPSAHICPPPTSYTRDLLQFPEIPVVYVPNLISPSPFFHWSSFLVSKKKNLDSWHFSARREIFQQCPLTSNSFVFLRWWLFFK